MVDISKVKEFYLADYNEMLFPMETCRYLVENAPTLISEFINNIQDPQKSEYCFLPQQTVSASKAKHHVRRTKKLDPVAEYYLYEMAYKNRTVFRKSTNPIRQNFGYRFADGQHVKIHDSYQEFTEQK
ncbi:hypothetical protein [Vibrio alginolyticus]|uniref:hypothetical protein n=1 Tax=Vibrio alginolyticus TaxID=663 RepID=UPI001A93252E|nr:hypothetical protein [Vibrio alginolyticus]